MNLTTGLTTQVAIEISSPRKGLVALVVSTLEKQAKVNYKAKVNAPRELQSTSGEELSALMPSVLDRAFKGEL